MKIGIVAVLSAGILVLVALMHTASADSKSGQPFADIWSAINELRNEIADLGNGSGSDSSKLHLVIAHGVGQAAKIGLP